MDLEVYSMAAMDKQPWVRCLVLALFILGPLAIVGCIAYSAWEIVVQDQVIRAYRPVNATIIRADWFNAPFVRHRPPAGLIVRYRYGIAAQSYVGEHLYPEDLIDQPLVQGQDGATVYLSRREARAMVLHLKAEKHPIAYYDPAQPQRSFLIRAYREGPYGFFLFSMIVWWAMPYVLGMVFMLWRGWRRDALLRVGGASYQLPPISLSSRQWASLGLVHGTVYLAAANWGFSQYAARMSAAPLEYAQYGICMGLGILALLLSLRLLWKWRSVGTPRLILDSNDVFTGTPVGVTVEQQIGNAAIRQIEVGLLCKQTVNVAKPRAQQILRTKVFWEVWRSFERLAPVGGLISATASFDLPVDAVPTSPSGQKPDYPMYVWTLRVRINVEPDRQLTTDYLLQVRAAAAPSGADPEAAEASPLDAQSPRDC